MRLLHRVVIKGRKLVKRSVEGNWQPAARIVNSRQGLSNCRAAFLARIPSFKNCGRVFCAQFTASALPFMSTTTRGLPVAASASSKFCCACGKSDVRAVAALKARDVDRHLFALEIRRESHEGHHHIRLLGSLHSLIAQHLDGRLPIQRGPSSEGWGLVHIFKPEGMRLGCRRSAT